MLITKDLTVTEVRARNVVNAPFEIVLRGDSWQNPVESSLTFDQKALERFAIPHALDLIGRTLVCVLESKELPFRKDDPSYGLDLHALRADDVIIDSLEKKESETSYLLLIPARRGSEVAYSLKLSTCMSADGFHPVTIPCPFYRLKLSLSEEEYELCKALSPAAVIGAHFSLK